MLYVVCMICLVKNGQEPLDSPASELRAPKSWVYECALPSLAVIIFLIVAKYVFEHISIYHM
jgi:hypothetical protein